MMSIKLKWRKCDMCGLYGFVNYSGEKMKNLADLTNSLSEQSAIRGTDATGIAFCNSSGINILKESKSAYRLDFKHSDEICSFRRWDLLHPGFDDNIYISRFYFDGNIFCSG